MRNDPTRIDPRKLKLGKQVARHAQAQVQNNQPWSVPPGSTTGDGSLDPGEGTRFRSLPTMSAASPA
jgi:hypothetical protein